MRKKTVYFLRTRLTDDSEWGPPEAFASKRERDEAGSYARILGGLRTHSYEEKMTPDEAEEVLDQ